MFTDWFFLVLSLFGGIALFLYGMHVLSDSLAKLAGGDLEILLKKMTKNRFTSLLAGIGATAAVQSSSAVTVMLVGLVNSGLLKFGQTVGILFGSNIGTTLTAWLFSLAGVSETNLLVRLLKPASLFPLLAIWGIVLILWARGTQDTAAHRRVIGGALVGLAILFCGMEQMSDAVSPLADAQLFEVILEWFASPLAGVLFGTVFTALIQSSSASVGILQALAITGKLPVGVAVPIIFGQNIGTCITTLLASIGANRNARRVAAVHISFNVIGSVIGVLFLYLFRLFPAAAVLSDTISPAGIAVVHTLFNVGTTLLLLPFAHTMEKLAYKLVPDSATPEHVHTVFLDERLLATPPLAVSECRNLAHEMAHLSAENILSALSLIGQYDTARAGALSEAEPLLDKYEDRLGTYLVRIGTRSLGAADNKTVSLILHTIGDWERIGDHALGVATAATELHEKKIELSEEASAELSVLFAATTHIVTLTRDAYENSRTDPSAIEPLSDVIDHLTEEMKARHVARLRAGTCGVTQGFVLSDLLTNIRRVGDHCSNIAAALSLATTENFDPHRFLGAMRRDNDTFTTTYEAFLSKFALPDTL